MNGINTSTAEVFPLWASTGFDGGFEVWEAIRGLRGPRNNPVL